MPNTEHDAPDTVWYRGGISTTQWGWRNMVTQAGKSSNFGMGEDIFDDTQTWKYVLQGVEGKYDLKLTYTCLL